MPRLSFALRGSRYLTLTFPLEGVTAGSGIDGDVVRGQVQAERRM